MEKGRGESGPPELALAAWFRQELAGCAFAASLQRGRRVVFAAIEPSAVDEVGAFFDASAASGHVGVAVFPDLRTADQVALLVSELSASPRWKASVVPWRHHAQANVAPLALRFETRGGLMSDAMGFAPLGTMPATRRAPYVAVAAWAGGVANTIMRVPSDGSIGFVNGPHPSPDDVEAHRRLLTQSDEKTRAILSRPPEDVVWLRKVAFLLPRSSVALHLGHL